MPSGDDLRAPPSSKHRSHTPDRSDPTQVQALPLHNHSSHPPSTRPEDPGSHHGPFSNILPPHKACITKYNSKYKILKALAGTNWSHKKETLSLPYNGLNKPILSYAALIWFPPSCNSNIKTLQTVQKSGTQSNNCLPPHGQRPSPTHRDPKTTNRRSRQNVEHPVPSQFLALNRPVLPVRDNTPGFQSWNKNSHPSLKLLRTIKPPSHKRNLPSSSISLRHQSNSHSCCNQLHRQATTEQDPLNGAPGCKGRRETAFPTPKLDHFAAAIGPLLTIAGLPAENQHTHRGHVS